jgi:hypothetical protein
MFLKFKISYILNALYITSKAKGLLFDRLSRRRQDRFVPTVKCRVVLTKTINNDEPLIIFPDQAQHCGNNQPLGAVAAAAY